jgi:hypothetical protein
MDTPQEAKKFVKKLELSHCLCGVDDDMPDVYPTPCFECQLIIKRLVRLLDKAVAVK